MKLFGYARVSTDEQVKSGSLEQQIKRIKKYCKENEHELIHVYADAGVSAVKQRPDMEKLLQKLRSGNGEGVVVTKLDRWGRSVKHLVMSVDELKQLGRHFISIDDNLNTQTTNGRLMFHILSAFAEFEREIIKERMQAGRERALAEGKRLHRPKKELDLKEIRRFYVDLGLSARAIAKVSQVSTSTILSRLREMGVEIK
jgi:DNA invertase Pin-like site-specific DNA recombinase